MKNSKIHPYTSFSGEIKFKNHYFTHINFKSYLLIDTFISNIIDILDFYKDESKN